MQRQDTWVSAAPGRLASPHVSLDTHISHVHAPDGRARNAPTPRESYAGMGTPRISRSRHFGSHSLHLMSARAHTADLPILLFSAVSTGVFDGLQSPRNSQLATFFGSPCDLAVFTGPHTVKKMGLVMCPGRRCACAERLPRALTHCTHRPLHTGMRGVVWR